jgi:hypothetical protein
MLRYLKWPALIAFGVALFLWIVGTLFGWMGCGSAKMDLELKVFDGHTGLPIEGAEIEITSWDGFPFHEEEHPEKRITVAVQTNADGKAYIFAGERFATMSTNAFHTTMQVRLPAWRYRVSAAGYVPLEDSGCGCKYSLPQEHTEYGTVKNVILWRLVREPAD